ncbi:lipopolysaccharide biosynthesis protein [Pelagibacterium mangrovi]|uniref:lipopolysaccharide biosynthesis protein n=1 Tax=Pelagibacterium mangrovi TaxID=3119828 RepID=UPI002FCAE724
MHKFVRSASLLILSGFVAQVLQFVGTIFLAQIYDPNAYGNLTLVVNWASVFAVACSLQLHIALHIAQSDSKAREIMGTVLITVPAVAVPTGIAAHLFAQDVLVLAIIMGAALALSNIGRSAQSRRSANLSIAGLSIGRAAVAVVAQFCFRSIGQGGLVLGLLVAEVTAAFVFITLSLKGGGRPGRAPIARVILQNRNFTIWGVMQELVSIGVVLLPFLICSLIYDTDIVGHYGITYRLLWAPAVILSFGFGLVFLTEVGRRPERFREILAELHFRKLVLLMIVAALSSILWMPLLFHLILGSKWDLAASMSPAVTIAATSFLASAPYRQLYRVHEKQRLQLCIDIGTMMLIAMTWILQTLDPVAWVNVICGIVVMQNSLMIAFARSFQRG